MVPKVGWARRKARTCSSHKDVVSCGNGGRVAGVSLSIMQESMIRLVMIHLARCISTNKL